MDRVENFRELKGPKHPDFVNWVVFPLPRVSSLDKMEGGPHIGKKKKKKGMLQQKRVVGGTTRLLTSNYVWAVISHSMQWASTVPAALMKGCKA